LLGSFLLKTVLMITIMMGTTVSITINNIVRYNNEFNYFPLISSDIF